MNKKHLHTLLRTMLGMSEPAWSVLRGTLMICCTLVFSAFVLIIGLEEITIRNYHIYFAAKELAQSPPALLLTAAIVSVCIEEQVRKS